MALSVLLCVVPVAALRHAAPSTKLAPSPLAPLRHAAPSANLEPPSPPPLGVRAQQAGVMWVAAALLGPVCDGRHSSHDVLHYAADSIAGAPWLLTAPDGGVLLETCWWVPVAFGGAGVVLGAAHPYFDRVWGGGRRPPPGWPTVAAAVAAFVLCYDYSGQLAQAAAASGLSSDLLGVDAPLLACAAVTFLVFERSWGGLLMMGLLATIGPAVEIGLIDGAHLYAYTHPNVGPIPSWIPWVYAAGGPANGALGRQVLHVLSERGRSKR